MCWSSSLTKGSSYFHNETLLCLNILNILHVGPPPLPVCTAQCPDPLQPSGWRTFLMPPPPAAPCLSPHPTFTYSTEDLPTFLLSGVGGFWEVLFFPLCLEVVRTWRWGNKMLSELVSIPVMWHGVKSKLKLCFIWNNFTFQTLFKTLVFGFRAVECKFRSCLHT